MVVDGTTGKHLEENIWNIQNADDTSNVFLQYIMYQMCIMYIM